VFYNYYLKYSLIVMLVMLPSVSRAAEGDGNIAASIVYTGTARKRPGAPFALSTFLAKQKALADIGFLPGKEILKPIGIPFNVWVKNAFSYFLGKAEVVSKSQNRKRATVKLKVHVPINRILDYKLKTILFRRGLVLISSSEFEGHINEDLRDHLNAEGFTVFKRGFSEILWSRWHKTYMFDGKAYSAFELASPYFSENIILTKISIGKKKKLSRGYLFPTHCVVTFMSVNAKQLEKKAIDYVLRGETPESALGGESFTRHFIKPIKSYAESWLKESAERNRAKISIRIRYKQADPDDLMYADKIKENFYKLITNLPYMGSKPVFSQQKDSAVITSSESPLSLVTRIDKNPIFNIVSWTDKHIEVSPRLGISK